MVLNMQDGLATFTTLGKLDIEELIPHSEGMCLLEKVTSYSPEEIICQTRSHLDDSNPLKIDGQLSKMHLIEYGAQAVAIHGGLLEKQDISSAEPKVGYIAMVKSVKWGDFDRYTPFLEIKAIQVMADEMTKLYEFDVSDAEQNSVCSGRVMVVHPDLES